MQETIDIVVTRTKPQLKSSTPVNQMLCWSKATHLRDRKFANAKMTLYSLDVQTSDQ